jgi:hypothetical protein
MAKPNQLRLHGKFTSPAALERRAQTTARLYVDLSAQPQRATIRTRHDLDKLLYRAVERAVLG